MPSSSASSSSACSSPKVPSITPGARNAFENPRLSLTGSTIERTFSQAYSVSAGFSTGNTHPCRPTPITAELSMPTSLPSASAPMRYVCTVGARWPAAMVSSLRE